MRGSTKKVNLKRMKYEDQSRLISDFEEKKYRRGDQDSQNLNQCALEIEGLSPNMLTNRNPFLLPGITYPYRRGGEAFILAGQLLLQIKRNLTLRCLEIYSNHIKLPSHALKVRWRRRRNWSLREIYFPPFFLFSLQKLFTELVSTFSNQ